MATTGLSCVLAPGSGIKPGQQTRVLRGAHSRTIVFLPAHLRPGSRWKTLARR